MANFQKAFDITRGVWEGGYVNLPQDKGGETYAGIARKIHPNNPIWVTIDFYKRSKYQTGIPRNTYFPDIEYLVKDFYKNIWTHYNLDEIKNDDVATLIFDYIIHSNITGAKNIQRILKVGVDGIFGVKTIAAINAKYPPDLFVEILDQRKAFLESLIRNNPTQKVFESGWMSRIKFFSKLAPLGGTGLALIIGIIFLIFIMFNL